MPDLRTVYLISCVSKKRSTPAQARDLSYISDWFLKARDYVESTRSPWFIFSAEHGLVPKWPAVEAMSRLPGTVARVKELTSHPAFTLKNPNKVYALLGQLRREPDQLSCGRRLRVRPVMKFVTSPSRLRV